jgi:hypothetical protein
MDLQGGNCPSCGGSEIQALPGGSLRCSHCGNYFADASRKSADPPSVHVHVHGVPTSAPAQHFAPPQPQYAPPQPFVPQYAPAPVGYYPPPQRKGMGGCMVAFIVVTLVAVVGFVGLVFLGVLVSETAPGPYSTPGAPQPGASGKTFNDVRDAINAQNYDELQRLLDADPALASSTGTMSYTSPDYYTYNLIGTTPLHLAAYYGNEGMVRLLIEKGADANAMAYTDDGTGFAATPLDLARQMGQWQVEDELTNAMWAVKGG